MTVWNETQCSRYITGLNRARLDDIDRNSYTFILSFIYSFTYFTFILLLYTHYITLLFFLEMFLSLSNSVLLVSSLLYLTAYAAPVATTPAVPAVVMKAPKTVFLLSGDSTTATQKPPSGGGWGDGFKNWTMSDTSVAYNYGHNGATTGSFIGGGDWNKVLNQTSYYAQQNATVYVTIQFGHNDMKQVNYTEKYRQNLIRMVGDVKSHSGIPVSTTRSLYIYPFFFFFLCREKPSLTFFPTDHSLITVAP